MFNLFGILMALLIGEYGRGQGMFVGWPSLAAVGVAVVGVGGFLNIAAAQVSGRLETLRIQARAALASESPQAGAVAARAAQEGELMARRVPLARVFADALILGAFYVLVTVFGWSDYVRLAWGVPRYLDIVPVLLPYFAMLATSWLAQARVENALHGPSWRAAGYVGFQLRANLMTIAPLVFINAAYWAVLTWLPVVDDVRYAFEYSEFLLLLALMLPILALIPIAVRFALRTKPLPQGPLRRNLEDFARRRRLRIGGLYEWQTGSRHFSTAFVIGLLPGVRYVSFTDALLRRFSEAEVMAVFAHEMGHVRHRHLWWLLGFIVSFSVAMLAVSHVAETYAPENFSLLLVGLLLFYGYAVFGFISRRFERQADDYAARETSPELIAGVLLKIGAMNPAAMDKRGWRHFSIRRRVAEIALATQRPDVRRVFDRQRRNGLLMVLAATLAASVFLARPVYEDVVSGFATYSLGQLDEARAAQAPEARIEELREQTLARTEAMRELEGDYALAAQQYEGIVAGLTGRESDALEQLARTSREKQQQAEDARERAYWQDWAVGAEVAQTALKNALRNNTTWRHEWQREVNNRR